MEFLRKRLKSGNSCSFIFGVLMFGPGLKKKIVSAKESSTFISVSVCYSLACHAGVKVSIPGSIH